MLSILLSSVSYSFVLSSEEFGCVIPQRGFRQGTLSPYYFLFYSEALSCLFNEAESDYSIKGVHISRHAPCVSHLLFADDTLVFCGATIDAMQAISKLLNRYEAALGQVINLEKSNMVLSKNLPIAYKELLASTLGVILIDKHDKYLGLPAVGG
ncbi:UNVERIFIED_CONTAM: hypothetical protein Sradi_7112000 [Sesamum radiatum]|uniref:Reverse transcriptase domain-containing protein n=1 Tax=Sesamum radiatum TaxID=300843 RepID=A0AAW2J333_SESRA